MNTAKIQKLVELGGSEWRGGNNHRVYINEQAIKNILGLRVSKYKTGNVCSASINGKTISNSEATKIILAKIYYDVAADKLQAAGLPAEYVAVINAKLN